MLCKLIGWCHWMSPGKYCMLFCKHRQIIMHAPSYLHFSCEKLYNDNDFCIFNEGISLKVYEWTLPNPSVQLLYRCALTVTNYWVHPWMRPDQTCTLHIDLEKGSHSHVWSVCYLTDAGFIYIYIYMIYASVHLHRTMYSSIHTHSLRWNLAVWFHDFHFVGYLA